MSWVQAEVRELKEGRYILIDEEPCRIMSISVSKPGKHGEAKARIEAIGLFDNGKRSVIYPVKHKVQVPVINKRSAQVLSIVPGKNTVQLMDMSTYEVFELNFSDEDKPYLEQGKEVLCLEAMGKRKIIRP
jgi:translation initiation factor 5A